MFVHIQDQKLFIQLARDMSSFKELVSNTIQKYMKGNMTLNIISIQITKPQAF